MRNALRPAFQKAVDAAEQQCAGKFSLEPVDDTCLAGIKLDADRDDLVVELAVEFIFERMALLAMDDGREMVAETGIVGIAVKSAG